MITNHYFLRYVSIALIAFVCASCGSETNKETGAEVPKITKTSFQASPATIKEVIVPPTLSLIESPALNENNLVAFGFRSSKAVQLVIRETALVPPEMRSKETTTF